MNCFSDELQDRDFVSWIAKKVRFQISKFLERKINRWKENNFKENRGRRQIALEEKQQVYDQWIDDSIPSVDFRNGRNTIKIRHDTYERRYKGLKNDKHPLKVKHKRGMKVYAASRKVAACTVRRLRKKLMKKNLLVSVGTIMNLKPVFITTPTDKEKVLCMCKLCLNMRLFLMRF